MTKKIKGDQKFGRIKTKMFGENGYRGKSFLYILKDVLKWGKSETGRKCIIAFGGMDAPGSESAVVHVVFSLCPVVKHRKHRSSETDSSFSAIVRQNKESSTN